ncbi:MAG: outer membrane receptor protein involved in Fe transport [Haliea salexigens]|jgi:outer membrane receptor protein involved in Fe transport|tara:strand:+ start:43549 stop:46293 length:2745 start_codon:yes stop_codon:yes gene_type:complete
MFRYLNEIIDTILKGKSLAMKNSMPQQLSAKTSPGTPVRLLARAVMTAVAGGAFAASAVQAQQLEEVVVTATKRTASMQDVPVAVSAITEQSMTEQGITDFADYIASLPNVTAGGRGPGQNEIYIRGAAIQAMNTTIQEANGSAPNVALYLDEQPVTAGGRNLDVYIADMERIEVLPGPQGTVFGSSSQAGTVRLITNKPVIDEFSASFKAGTSFMPEGDPSANASAVFNFPLIENRLAARVLIFNDRQGGYIDNVRGTFTPDPSRNPALPSADGVVFTPSGGDPTGHQFADGSYAEPGRAYGVQYESRNNDALAEEDFNDATYQGFRAGVKYLINDDWDLLLTHHQQQLDADGVFDYDPEVGDLEVERYHPDRLTEDFSQTAWTLQGRLGELELLYTGAYLKRETDQIIDYSNYANTGFYIAGYMCEYNTPGYHGGGGVGYTFDPTLSGDPDVIECSNSGAGFAAISNEMERTTHELRFNTDPARWIRFQGGVFYEDVELQHVGDFNYGDPDWNAPDPGQLNGGSGPLVANDPNERGATTQFSNDITRPEEQIAVFGELAFDFLQDFTFAYGFRYYDLEAGFEGFSILKYGNRPVPNLANGNAANNPDVVTQPDVTGGRDYVVNIGDFQPASVDDTIHRLTLSWRQSDDLMFYATWSEGFRPQGFNRAVAGSEVTPQADGSAPCKVSRTPEYCIPLIYESDELVNYEMGWKGEFMDRRLRFNGAAYYIEWDGMQVGHIDSQNIDFLTIVDNAGDAEIRGIEGDFSWLATANLSLFGAFSWNDTEIVDLNPAFAFAVTDVGSQLPLAPEFQFSLRGRYEWDVFEGTAHAQLASRYSDEAYSSIIDVPQRRELQDSYVITDATLGYRQDTWTAELFINNLTDERAQLHINTQDGSRKILTNRPLEFGMRFTYDLF